MKTIVECGDQELLQSVLRGETSVNAAARHLKNEASKPKLPLQHNGDDPPRDNGGAATPQRLFDRCNQLAIEICGEPMTLDVAAAKWNYKCERYFTEQDNGLTRDWDAKAAWCNPPYSVNIIQKFVEKALDAARHGTTTFCLLPWWNYPYLDLCEQYGRIHRVCGPVTFQRQDGTATTLNSHYGTSQLVVVVFGPTIRPGFGAPIRKEGAEGPAIPGDKFDGEGEGGHHGLVSAAPSATDQKTESKAA